MIRKSNFRDTKDTALIVALLSILIFAGWISISPAAGHPTPAAEVATIALTPVADSYVKEFDSANYGAAPDLLVNKSLVDETFSRALLQFDMTSVTGQLPPGSTVVTATLQLYLSTAINSSVMITATTGHTTNWSELGVNWDNQPTWGAPSDVRIVDNLAGYKTWDVTVMVLGWLDGSLPNNGVGLLGEESGSDFSRGFDSRSGVFPPRLIIGFIPPIPTPEPDKATVLLYPTTGTVGTGVTLAGFTFPDAQCGRYDAFWTGKNQPAILLGGVEPQPGGRFALNFTVPDTSNGHHRVEILGSGPPIGASFMVENVQPVAKPQPQAATTANITVIPNSGAPGTTVAVTGSGFSVGLSCTPVNFYWVVQIPIAGGFISYPTFMGTGWLQSDGTVGYSFIAPPYNQGTYQILAVGPNSQMATTTFTVCCLPPPPPPPPPGPSPVTINVCANQDAYISNQYIDRPANNQDLAYNAYYNVPQEADFFNIPLVFFDLTGIPPGSTVLTASFQAYLESASGASTVPAGIYAMNGSWSENTVTYETANPESNFRRGEAASTSVGTGAGYVSWDISSLAQEWVDSPQENYGLMMWPTSGAPSDYTRTFTSKEGGTNCPRLIMTYDPSTAGPDLFIRTAQLVQAVGSGTASINYLRDQSSTIASGYTGIAGKSTLLRVYIGTPQDFVIASGSVTGYSCGSSTPLPGSPLSSNRYFGEILARMYPSSFNLSDTLNFSLPTGWTAGCIDLSMAISAIRPTENPNQLANNTARWNSVNFTPMGKLPLVLVPYLSIQTGQTANANSASSRGILQWVNNIYPLPDNGFDLWITERQITSEVLPADQGNLLDEMEDMYDAVMDAPPDGMSSDTRFMAIVPANCGGCGAARVDYDDAPYAGTVAWSDTSNAATGSLFSLYGRTWAQEIGHLFGRKHASNAHNEEDGGDVDDYYPRSDFYFDHGGIGSYGMALITEQWQGSSPFLIQPGTASSHAHDFMSYGGNPWWVSPYTYYAMAQLFRGMTAAWNLSPVRVVSPIEQLVVIGHVDANNNLSLRPLYRKFSSIITPGTSGEFSVELLDSGGATLSVYRFDGQVNTHEAGVIHFTAHVPWQTSTRRVVLKRNNVFLGERLVSPNTPTVKVLFPNGGEVAGDQMTITWDSNDSDGDALTYAVFYKTGGEFMLHPLGVGITAKSLTVDTAMLPGSTQGRILVRVTDGVNSAEDESDAPFTVLRKEPAVGILFPEDGMIFRPGTPLLLEGFSYDPEERTLPADHMTWTSDRDGLLGEGSHLWIALTPGLHHITLRAVDNDNQEATAQVTILVGYRLFLPFVMR